MQDVEPAPRHVALSRWIWAIGCLSACVGMFAFGGPDGGETGRWMWGVGWSLRLVGLAGEFVPRLVRRAWAWRSRSRAR